MQPLRQRRVVLQGGRGADAGAGGAGTEGPARRLDGTRTGRDQLAEQMDKLPLQVADLLLGQL